MARKPRADELNSVPIATAARVLGVSRQSIYDWAASGKVKLYPVATRLAPTGEPALRVMRADLDQLLRQRKGRK